MAEHPSIAAFAAEVELWEKADLDGAYWAARAKGWLNVLHATVLPRTIAEVQAKQVGCLQGGEWVLALNWALGAEQEGEST